MSRRDAKGGDKPVAVLVPPPSVKRSLEELSIERFRAIIAELEASKQEESLFFPNLPLRTQERLCLIGLFHNDLHQSLHPNFVLRALG